MAGSPLPSAAFGGGGVKVEGLRELRRACSVIGEDMPLYLRDEMKKLAEIVAVRARAKVPVGAGPQTAHSTSGKPGAARASIRPVMAGGGAAVIGGRKSIPYYGWLDFGGIIKHYPHANIHHTMQHLIRRDFIKTGRYLYPSADEAAVEIGPLVEAMLDRLFVKAGWV